MHSLLRRTAGLVALVAAIALISGCGSDSSSLSADELRTQADAACAEAKTALDALAAPTGNDDVLPFLTSGRDITAAAVDKLKKLTPPDDLKGDWERVITLNDEQLAALDSTITKIESKELTPEAALSEFGSAADARTTELRELATKLGLKVCGAPDDASTGDENGSTTAATETSTDAITDVEPTTDAPTTDAPTTDAGTGTTTQYVADAKEAADALTEFGNILSSTESIEKFKSKAPQAQEALDRFDAAIAKLDGYRMDDSTLEQQRAGLVEKGPAVSDVLRRFVDAAAANDEQATTDLLSEVMTALTEFSEAATNPTK